MARSRKARSGKPPWRRRSTRRTAWWPSWITTGFNSMVSSATSWRSRRWWTNGGRSAGTRWRSTATISPPSKPRWRRPRRPRASPPASWRTPSRGRAYRSWRTTRSSTAWLKTLAEVGSETKPAADQASAVGLVAGDREEFAQAIEFLFVVRCFLHYRHERDDNTLDWQAQDAAAAARIGLERRPGNHDGQGVDAAYWMRLYFRHARSVERRLIQMLEGVPAKQRAGRWALPGMPGLAKARRRAEPAPVGYRVEGGRAILDGSSATVGDPAQDPEIVLQLFATMARTGCLLDRRSEERMSQALPLLSTHLEEGPVLWRHLREVLMGPQAGKALRAMHAMGFLELLILEFHGIDALVIRDAYHRYTVDEHTMVVIDTLHALQAPQSGPMAEWASRFGGILRDVQHPDLLYLGALLHDTGKGRSTGDHARESARMGGSEAGRLGC